MELGAAAFIHNDCFRKIRTIHFKANAGPDLSIDRNLGQFADILHRYFLIQVSLKESAAAIYTISIVFSAAPQTYDDKKKKINIELFFMVPTFDQEPGCLLCS